MIKQSGFNIKDDIRKIQQKKTYYGVLGKMDAVLQLTKRGYDYAMIEYALWQFAKRIKNKQARDIAMDVYLSRVK